MGALPPRPPPSINGRPSHPRLLPALPCRPGETFSLPAARLRFLFAGRWPDRLHFFRCGKTCTPGPQGGPGRSRWGAMNKFYVVRGPGGFAPWSASTASKRWHLSCLLLSVMKEVRPRGRMPEKVPPQRWRLFRFLFGRSKRNIDNGWIAVHPVGSLSTLAPFLLTSFGGERSKVCGWMPLKNSARTPTRNGNLPLLVLEPHRQHQINEILAFFRQHLHRA